MGLTRRGSRLAALLHHRRSSRTMRFGLDALRLRYSAPSRDRDIGSVARRTYGNGHVLTELTSGICTHWYRGGADRLSHRSGDNSPVSQIASRVYSGGRLRLPAGDPRSIVCL